jgi:hypothetical protein
MSSVIDWKKQEGIRGAHVGLYPNAMNIAREENPISERSVLTTGIPVTEKTVLMILRAITAMKQAVKKE